MIIFKEKGNQLNNHNQKNYFLIKH